MGKKIAWVPLALTLWIVGIIIAAIELALPVLYLWTLVGLAAFVYIAHWMFKVSWIGLIIYIVIGFVVAMGLSFLLLPIMLQLLIFGAMNSVIIEFVLTSIVISLVVKLIIGWIVFEKMRIR